MDEATSEFALYPEIRKRLPSSMAWTSDLVTLLNQLWMYGIERIQEPGLRKLIEEFTLERVPIPFFLEPTSHSGKHHPSWQNKPNGTLRHIVETCVMIPMLAQTVPGMLNRDKEPIQLALDVAMAGTIISDTFKTDVTGQSTKANHGRVAAQAWREFALPRRRTYPEIVERVARTCEYHYGVFSPGWTDGQELEPETQLVSIVDVASSSKIMELLFDAKRNIG